MGELLRLNQVRVRIFFLYHSLWRKVRNEMVVLALIPMSDYVAAKPKSLGLLSYFIIEA